MILCEKKKAVKTRAARCVNPLALLLCCPRTATANPKKQKSSRIDAAVLHDA
jgi:hypothetical protein